MANADQSTRYMVWDCDTKSTYAIKLDAAGKCTALQLFNNVIQTVDGRVVTVFGPAAAPAPSLTGTVVPKDDLPYGQTTVAMELRQDGQKGKVFTLVWPTKEEVAKGALPAVAQKDRPEDLIKSGFAPTPKGQKNVKGAGIGSEEELKSALENIETMIGLDTAKRDIRQNIALARFNSMKEEYGIASKPISRHMVFTGNPGTGKTTFAREVAKVYHALGFIEKPTVHEVKREDLVAGFVGQTAIKTKEAIDKAKGGILFIDEAYALSREAGGGDGKDFGGEAINTLVAAMENMREDLIVIVAGYPEPMKRFIDANEGLKSRFMTYINFDDYNLPQLGQIMDGMIKERGYTMTAEAQAFAMNLLDEEKTRAKKDFGNGRTVRNLVEKAEKELAMRLEDEKKLNKNHGLSDEDMKSALTTITLADVRNISLKGIGANASNRTIDFGAAAKPKNDNVKPAAPAMSGGGHKFRL